jgi:hypothetical protein
MPLTEAQKRASRNFQRRKEVGNTPVRWYMPKEQYKALKRFSKDRKQTIESVANELVAAGLNARGYRFKSMNSN